jgi:acetyl-CoA acetyltransferase
MTEHLEDRCIISGIGQSDVGRRLSKGVMDLTLDAVLEAIADAGLTPADIDGVMSWPGAITRNESLAPSGPGGSGPGPHAVIDALRLKPTWYYGGPETPGMFAAVIHACMAVATGMCRHVVVYRALNEATAWRTVTDRVATDTAGVTGPLQWMLPFGAFSGPTWMGHWATRHMHEFGTTREQIAAIALNGRRNAQKNPKAVLQGDLTMEDYLSSKMISDPLCLFDCDIAVDGVTALIVSTADYAPDVPTTAIHFEAVGSALQGRASWDQWEDMGETAAASAGKHLWSRTDLRPADVDVANLYDGFSVLSLFWLEGLGFCGKGEGGPFVEGGTRIALDGELPLATSGGQLSAGRLHGFGHLYESCLQLRGQAGERQVKAAKVAVTSAGAGPLASCLLLRTDA